MKRILYVFFFVGMVTLSANQHFHPDEQVAVSFSSPYPSSPIKQIKALATKLWGEVNASLQDANVKDQLENTITNFAHAMLDLNTLCDVLVADVNAQLGGVGLRYQSRDVSRTLEEVQYLLQLIQSLDENFDSTMQGHISDQAACIKVVLNRIKKKMERTLHASAP